MKNEKTMVGAIKGELDYLTPLEAEPDLVPLEPEADYTDYLKTGFVIG